MIQIKKSPRILYGYLHKNESGQSLVEFALILPIILLLVLGMIEFGWLLNGKITLNSAAREGARVAVVLNVSDTERKQRVYDTINSTLESSGITVKYEDLEVTPDSNIYTDVNDMVIKVKGSIKPIIGLYVPNTVTMSSMARMRKE